MSDKLAFMLSLTFMLNVVQEHGRSCFKSTGFCCALEYIPKLCDAYVK